MIKGIAFFDFDGTITTKDTLLEFIKFSKGTVQFYTGFLLNSPYLVAYKLKIISNQAAKEKILRYFFKNVTAEKFQEDCNRFAEEVVPGLIRPKALEEFGYLKERGFSIVIVSASPENWISKWAASIEARLIATKLETRLGKLTGRINGKNCYGNEKVRRIKELYTLADFSFIAAYGDSSGDKPMLSLANNAYMKPFRN